MSALSRETADDLMELRLRKSVAQTCKHREARKVSEQRMPDTGDWKENWYCESCDTSWTIWPEEGA